MDERDKDARTGAADGMAECDGATVHIHLELRTIVNVFITRDISKEPATLLNFLPSFVLISYEQGSLNIVFSLICCDSSELRQFCCSAGVWPAIVYTNWHRGEAERGQSPEYILKSSKKHYI